MFIVGFGMCANWFLYYVFIKENSFYKKVYIVEREGNYGIIRQIFKVCAD